MENSNPTEFSNTLPAGVRIEHLVGDVDFPEKEILSLLKAAMGGDDSPPSMAGKPALAGLVYRSTHWACIGAATLVRGQ